MLARVHLHMHYDPTSVILEADGDLSTVSVIVMAMANDFVAYYPY